MSTPREGDFTLLISTSTSIIKQHPMRCNNTLDSEINAEAANTIECDGFSCSHFYYFQSQTHQRNIKNKVLAV